MATAAVPAFDADAPAEADGVPVAKPAPVKKPRAKKADAAAPVDGDEAQPVKKPRKERKKPAPGPAKPVDADKPAGGAEVVAPEAA